MAASKSMSELLDKLCTESECAYISDLHDERYAAGIAKALSGIPAEHFSAEVWRAAAEYITKRTVAPADAETCRQHLLLTLTGATGTENGR